MARLRRADTTEPGLTRRGRGRGFEYLDADGERTTDPDVVDRIRSLAIPPAWRDVWICTHPMGHIQATEVDAAGRKQYRYHDEWRQRRDQQKFDSMVDFGRALPAMRRRVARGDYTAKDFRTWNATVLAAVGLAVSEAAATGSKRARERAIRRAIEEVSRYLGNTAAVSRDSYIDPRVIDRFRDGVTLGGVVPELGEGGDLGGVHGAVERAVLDLLVGGESDALEDVAA